jgi:tetratricopeptide (TPR) repeat protein
VRAFVIAIAVVAHAAPAAADAVARRLIEDGDAAAARGDRALALARYEAALDADPDAADAYLRAVPLWLDGESLDTAVRYLERGATRNPEWAHLWYALGYAYRRQHRTDDALAAYDEYVRIRPTDPAPHYGLGVLHAEAGAAAAAVAAYRRYRALEVDASRADFRRQAARAIARLASPPARRAEHVIRLVGDGGGVGAWLAATASR